MEHTTSQKDQQKQLILGGRMPKVMWQLSWPAVIAMVLYGFNAVLDGIFVGRYVGSTALAGVSIAAPIAQLAVALGSLVGVGAGSVLSIALGANDTQTQSKLMGCVNALSFIVSAIFMAICLPLSAPLISMMGGTAEALAYGDTYLRINLYGTLFSVYGLATNMIMRAEGKMKTAALIMGIGLAVNALFNYIFMAVLDMGVAGAAWGTNVGMLAYAVLGFLYFSSKRASFDTDVKSLRLDKSIGASIMKLGASSFIMSIMNMIQALVVFNALARYGTTEDIAFYGAVYRVFTFLLTPIMGLMRALQPAIGINYGAKQYDRVMSAYKTFAFSALLLTLPFWIISMVAPTLILELMLPGQAFSSAELLYFRIHMALLPMMSFIFMGMTLFPSIDKPKPAILLGLARQLVFYIPVMLLLPKAMGVLGVYVGSVSIDLLISAATLFLVGREFSRLRSEMRQPVSA